MSNCIPLDLTRLSPTHLEHGSQLSFVARPPTHHVDAATWWLPATSHSTVIVKIMVCGTCRCLRSRFDSGHYHVMSGKRMHKTSVWRWALSRQTFGTRQFQHLLTLSVLQFTKSIERRVHHSATFSRPVVIKHDIILECQLSSLLLQLFRDSRDKLVFDHVKLHDVGRLLSKPVLVKLIEQIHWTYKQTNTLSLDNQHWHAQFASPSDI